MTVHVIEDQDFLKHILKNFVVHPMTTSQRVNMSDPKISLFVFDTDEDCLYYYAADATAFTDVFAYRNAGLSHASSGSFVVVPLDASNWDAGSELAANKITVVKAGKFSAEGAVSFASNTTGNRGVAILVNGALIRRGAMIAAPSTLPVMPVATVLNLAADDYVEIAGYQNSGGTLAYSVGTQRTYLSLRRYA